MVCAVVVPKRSICEEPRVGRAVVVPKKSIPEEGQCVPLIDAVVVEKSPIPEESNSAVEDSDVRNRLTLGLSEWSDSP